jgi:chromosomal replication initiation ATPase DnaA
MQGGFGGKNLKLNLMKKTIFDNYSNTIAKEFHLTLGELFQKTKTPQIVDARKMLYYLCMERPIKIGYILSYLKEKGFDVGHSTVLNGYKQAKKLIDTDPDYENLIKVIQEND